MGKKTPTGNWKRETNRQRRMPEPLVLVGFGKHDLADMIDFIDTENEERLISEPYETGWPPSYKYDCLPDPPQFKNPFAWNGKGAATRRAPVAAEKRDAQAFEDCQKQLPTDSIEAEAAHDQRQLEQWGSGKLGPR